MGTDLHSKLLLDLDVNHHNLNFAQDSAEKFTGGHATTSRDLRNEVRLLWFY